MQQDGGSSGDLYSTTTHRHVDNYVDTVSVSKAMQGIELCRHAHTSNMAKCHGLI